MPTPSTSSARPASAVLARYYARAIGLLKQHGADGTLQRTSNS